MSMLENICKSKVILSLILEKILSLPRKKTILGESLVEIHAYNVGESRLESWWDSRQDS